MQTFPTSHIGATSATRFELPLRLTDLGLQKVDVLGISLEIVWPCSVRKVLGSIRGSHNYGISRAHFRVLVDGMPHLIYDPAITINVHQPHPYVGDRVQVLHRKSCRQTCAIDGHNFSLKFDVIHSENLPG